MITCLFLYIIQANAVIDMIGFPEYILNKTRLNQEYKDVSNAISNGKVVIWDVLKVVI